MTTQVFEMYADSLKTQRASAIEAASEAGEMWSLIEGWSIQTQDEYAECGALLKEVKGKIKFLDDERKISVGPLNEEVKRVNDWFRPALDRLKQISDHAMRLMGSYTLRQKQEEQRLLQEAQAAAQAVLATEPDVHSAAGMQQAASLVTEASNAAAPKVSGIGVKPVWKFDVVDAAALVRAHPELAMPDMKAIGAWVKEHGDKNVPTGVKVVADVRFNVRSA